MSNDGSGLIKVLAVGGGAVALGWWLFKPAEVAAFMNAISDTPQGYSASVAADEGGMSQRGMLVTDPSTEGPTTAQAEQKASQALAVPGFSWEWGREVGRPIDYATGHQVSVRDRGAVSRVVTFAGHDPLNRASQWRSSRTTVARIPWDTAPSNYDWTGGTPSPKDSKRPPDPDAVERLLSGAKVAGSVVLGLDGVMGPQPLPWNDPVGWLRGVIGLPQ